MIRRTLRLALPAVAFLTFAAQSLFSQQARDQPLAPTVGTSSIVGTVVVNEPNSQPLRRVSIFLNGRMLQRQTVTDDKGRFAFVNLPAGTYSAPRASKGGFVAATYGQTRPDGIGIPITLTEGQRLTIAFKLLRGAVITGTIQDRGRPVAQTNVSATPIRTVNGVRSPAGFRTGFATTDDRGVYRMYGLAPGDYIVAVSPRLIGLTAEMRAITDAEIQWAERQLQPGAAQGSGAFAQTVLPPPGPAVAYTPVYYPGTTDVANAAMVTLAAGQERAGIDFGVSYVATARIEGTILDPDGQPAATAQMNLVPMLDPNAAAMGDTSFLMESMMMSRPTISAGKFSLPNVRPGRYTLAARGSSRASAGAGSAPPGRAGGPSPMNLWASAEVTVTGEDQTGIVLRLQPGMELTGKVVFEASTLQPPTDLSRMQVRLTAAPTAGVSVSINIPSTVPANDGTFALEGISPGKYLVTAFQPASGPAGGASWTLKSIKVGEIDAADVPFEVRPNDPISNVVVTFTDKSSELTGTLLDATGQPTTALSIILFSTDKNMWSQRSRRLRAPVRAGTDGKFRFTTLLPGEYYLAALSDFEQSDVYKPEFLEQVAAAAMKITIGEGEKKIQDLKIAGGGLMDVKLR